MRIYFYLLCILLSCREIHASQFTTDTVLIDPHRCIVGAEEYDEHTRKIKVLTYQPVYNPTNVASLIAIAVVLKDNKQLNIQNLNNELSARYGNIDESMNLLGVKNTLIQLGYSAYGVKSDRPLELLTTQNMLAFALDEQHVYHLVYIHDNKAYLIYGLNHICPISLHYYVKWYANRNLLILN